MAMAKAAEPRYLRLGRGMEPFPEAVLHAEINVSMANLDGHWLPVANSSEKNKKQIDVFFQIAVAGTP